MSTDQQFNVQSLQFKSLEQILELTKDLEQQGNIDLNFRISELQDKIVSEQRSRYRKEVLKISDASQSDITNRQIDDCDSDVYETSSKRKDDKMGWQKDLSKRIALKTHPDKLRDLKDEDTDYYTELYRKSTKAYQEEDDALLLVCGHEVRLKPKNLSLKHVGIIKTANGVFGDQIKKKQNSDGYIWYHMSEKDKTQFLMNYVKQRGFSINEEQAVEIIKRHKPPPRKHGTRPHRSLKDQRKMKNEK